MSMPQKDARLNEVVIALTDTKIRTVKPKNEIYRLSDSGSQYIEVMLLQFRHHHTAD
jgi:hypothetical protein